MCLIWARTGARTRAWCLGGWLPGAGSPPSSEAAAVAGSRQTLQRSRASSSSLTPFAHSLAPLMSASWVLAGPGPVWAGTTAPPPGRGAPRAGAWVQPLQGTLFQITRFSSLISTPPPTTLSPQKEKLGQRREASCGLRAGRGAWGRGSPAPAGVPSWPCLKGQSPGASLRPSLPSESTRPAVSVATQPDVSQRPREDPGRGLRVKDSTSEQMLGGTVPGAAGGHRCRCPSWFGHPLPSGPASGDRDCS